MPSQVGRYLGKRGNVQKLAKMRKVDAPEDKGVTFLMPESG
jgi:hypothetical protein